MVEDVSKKNPRRLQLEREKSQRRGLIDMAKVRCHEGVRIAILFGMMIRKLAHVR